MSDDDNVDTDRKPVQNMTDSELLTEKRDLGEMMVSMNPTRDVYDYVADRNDEVWSEIRERAETEPPECDECGSTRYAQAAGEPVVCRGCGRELWEGESAVHDAWSQMKAELSGSDGGKEIATDGGVNEGSASDLRRDQQDENKWTDFELDESESYDEDGNPIEEPTWRAECPQPNCEESNLFVGYPIEFKGKIFSCRGCGWKCLMSPLALEEWVENNDEVPYEVPA